MVTEAPGATGVVLKTDGASPEGSAARMDESSVPDVFVTVGAACPSAGQLSCSVAIPGTARAVVFGVFGARMSRVPWSWPPPVTTCPGAMFAAVIVPPAIFGPVRW